MSIKTTEQRLTLQLFQLSVISGIVILTEEKNPKKKEKIIAHCSSSRLFFPFLYKRRREFFSPSVSVSRKKIFALSVRLFFPKIERKNPDDNIFFSFTRVSSFFFLMSKQNCRSKYYSFRAEVKVLRY